MELAERIRAHGALHEQHALDLMLKCLQLYGCEGVAFSFNGGKDCTVVLHLLRAACALQALSLTNICCVYFRLPDAQHFEEMESFMREAASQSGLILEEIELGYKEGMIQLLARHPGIKAIFMGQRKTDPYGAHLDEVHPSDSDRGWPLFLRVNPILAWSFKDVWNFLRGYKLDYCCLYDQGYTSLGDVHKTRKNDDLLVEGKYMPAYMLGDELKERSGRKSFGVQKKGDIGLIIVGNEILSGMIQDSNSRFLCRELRKLGFHVQRISVIPDEIDKIGAEACSFSPEFDYVFICGGLGPTLDDVTMKGISYGFKVPLERNAALLEALKLALGDKFMPKHLVMANIPKGSELIFSESNPYPLVMFK